MRARAQGMSIVLFALLVSGLGCGSTTLRVYPTWTELPATGLEVRIVEVADVRPFGSASNRAPVPTVRGDPHDSDLTERVVGRWLQHYGRLGANMALEPPQAVPDLVADALVSGLRSAGYRAFSGAGVDSDGAVPLSARIDELWLYERLHGGLGTVAYRIRITITGPLDGFRDGRVLQGRGSVSAGGVDRVLWRRALERALELIAALLSAEAPPAGYS